MRISEISHAAPASQAIIGGGEMGALMRARDWSATPVGPMASWPQSLRTALSILLASGYPMYIAWGPEFVQFYNDAYRPILGSKHPVALGQSSYDCFPEIWGIIGPMFRSVIETGEATTVTDQLLPLERNGYTEECYFDFSYSVIRDETGAVGGIYVTCTETTNRVLSVRRMAALKALSDGTAGARTAAEACAAIQSALDAHRIDVPFALLYQVEPGDSLRLVAATGVDPATLPERIPHDESAPWEIGRAGLTGAPVLLEELPPLDLRDPSWPERVQSAVTLSIAQAGSDSPAAYLICGVSPRRAFDTEYRSFVEMLAGGVATALAHARAYEIERERAEALAELDRAKTAFFSNTSHEFRTPLTLMLGPLEELLALPHLEPPARERIDLVHRNSVRLLKLVNTLLDFSRIESGRIQALYEPVDLAEATADLAGAFRSAIETAGLRLVVDCPPLREDLYVDRDMWEKIVLNLLSNAFKFTFTGEIAVKLREERDSVTLEVRDTGDGIPEEHLPHIFERFHRVEGARGRTHEGSGIGLALVSELAKLHGGSVSVESTVNAGTTVAVTLPKGCEHLPADRVRAVGHRRSAGAVAIPYVSEAMRWLPDHGASTPAEWSENLEELAEGAAPLHGARVLVVDDNADMRDYLKRLLGATYVVSTATNGREAIEAIERDPPDLVLTDVMMPEIDGFELLSRIRSNPAIADLPVALISARAGEEARIEGAGAGADDYIVKPFNARELAARVQSLLQLSALRREAATEREGLIADLRLERARLTEVFMQAPAFMTVLRGPEFRFELANTPYLTLIGRTEVVGKPIAEVMPELAGQGYLEILADVYYTGKPFVGSGMQVDLERTPGILDEVYVDFVYQPLRDASGTTTGIFVLGVDITERKRAEEAREAAYQQIDTLNDRLKRSMVETHHRVKNNLQVIAALVEMLLLDHPDQIPSESVKRIGSHVHSLAVVHDLLTQNARQSVGDPAVDIEKVIERLARAAGEAVHGRRIHVEAEPLKLTPRQAASIALTANEIVSNAIKHGRGDIFVRLTTGSGGAIVAVEDDGPGFPPGFDPEVAGHTGLELVTRIVQWDLRGEVRFENRPSGGGRVVIEFPIEDAG
jgi:PAS domain S-box-containing protein